MTNSRSAAIVLLALCFSCSSSSEDKNAGADADTEVAPEACDGDPFGEAFQSCVIGTLAQNLSTIIDVAADLTQALAVEPDLAGAKGTFAEDYAAQWPGLVCTDQGV